MANYTANAQPAEQVVGKDVPGDGHRPQGPQLSVVNQMREH